MTGRERFGALGEAPQSSNAGKGTRVEHSIAQTAFTYKTPLGGFYVRLNHESVRNFMRLFGRFSLGLREFYTVCDVFEVFQTLCKFRRDLRDCD